MYGHPAMEPGAIVRRVAPTFLRLGNYQMLTAREETANLKTLTDFTIKHFFPHLGTPNKETYVGLLTGSLYFNCRANGTLDARGFCARGHEY